MPAEHAHNWVVRYHYYTSATEIFTLYRCTEPNCYAQHSEYTTV